ncbi:MAG: hypothetical protein P1P80_09275, partial [ANME-2 cluster archaeon]|nr:hypothetical protein [ANME-2 cluster archaeon]
LNSVNNSPGLLYQNNISRISHYGTNDSLVPTYSNTSGSQCNGCHTNTTIGLLYGDATQSVMPVTNIECYECHNGTWSFVRKVPSYPRTWVFYPAETDVFHAKEMGTYWACSTCH